MKYINGLIAICLISVLTFCTGEKEAIKETGQSNFVSKRLSESAIFVKDSIEYGRLVASSLQIDESRKCFLKGVDLLINKRYAKESIGLFTEAIRYFPDERYFFYLTKAFISIGDADRAKNSNMMCLEYNYEPYYEVAFNDALISAIRNDTTRCLDNLNSAIYEGFLNKDKIINEKLFDFIRDDDRYISMIVNTFNDDKKLRAMLFKNYLKLIPDLNLPFIESIDSVANHSNEKYINYDYAVFIPEMENSRFSRDVTNEYLYVGKINLENNYFAVVYKTYFAIADTLNPTSTYIITYDSLGSVIDNEIIGCFCSPTTSQVFTIGADFTIESSEYTYKWKNDPIEKGYAGNKIESFEVAKAKQIQLGELGIIKRISIAANSGIPSTKDVD
jgi:hypothetical protein